ncbi:alpha/beta hydrolase [Rhodobacteraceae bacterium D3-12]|nr:alpha/beta hydrolase [Rhodobacteraceae bacterium D3-12]
MSLPRFRFVPVLGHEIHVSEWGDRRNPGLVMWHGLARTGRDFDELAAALSERYFVICPDTIGRGMSSWAREPEAEYSVRFMAELAVGLLDHYALSRVDWIGTSMGGLIGMRLASGAAAGRIGRLILNDIGPEVPQGAIDRILAYVGVLPEFDTVRAGGAWLRTTYAPFGAAPEGFWERMIATSLRRRGMGV